MQPSELILETRASFPVAKSGGGHSMGQEGVQGTLESGVAAAEEEWEDVVTEGIRGKIGLD